MSVVVLNGVFEKRQDQWQMIYSNLQFSYWNLQFFCIFRHFYSAIESQTFLFLVALVELTNTVRFSFKKVKMTNLKKFLVFSHYSLNLKLKSIWNQCFRSRSK